MTFSENIQEDVWQWLGPQKFLLGRQRVRAIVDQCVIEWPAQAFAFSRGIDERDMVASGFAKRIAQDQFGSILMLLFIGLVTSVIQVLLEWWLLKIEHRIQFAEWRDEVIQ